MTQRIYSGASLFARGNSMLNKKKHKSDHGLGTEREEIDRFVPGRVWCVIYVYELGGPGLSRRRFHLVSRLVGPFR